MYSLTFLDMVSFSSLNIFKIANFKFLRSTCNSCDSSGTVLFLLIFVPGVQAILSYFFHAFYFLDNLPFWILSRGYPQNQILTLHVLVIVYLFRDFFLTNFFKVYTFWNKRNLASICLKPFINGKEITLNTWNKNISQSLQSGSLCTMPSTHNQTDYSSSLSFNSCFHIASRSARVTILGLPQVCPEDVHSPDLINAQGFVKAF